MLQQPTLNQRPVVAGKGLEISTAFVNELFAKHIKRGDMFRGCFLTARTKYRGGMREFTGVVYEGGEAVKVFPFFLTVDYINEFACELLRLYSAGDIDPNDYVVKIVDDTGSEYFRFVFRKNRFYPGWILFMTDDEGCEHTTFVKFVESYDECCEDLRGCSVYDYDRHNFGFDPGFETNFE